MAEGAVVDVAESKTGNISKIKGLRGALYRKIAEKKHAKEAEKRKRALTEEPLPGFKIQKTEHIVEFPSMKDITKIDVTYPLMEPFAYVNIRWSEELKELMYLVLEPELNEEEKKLMERISDALIELVEVELTAIKKEGKVIDYIEKQIKKVLKDLGTGLTPTQYTKIMYYIYRNFVGFNEIEPLLQDPNIEDISCDGIGMPMYIIHRKFGSLKTDIIIDETEYLREFIIKLSERCGRYVSYAEPILDGTLPDGSRVSATLAGDVATRGPTFTIRKFGEKPLSPTDQIRMKTTSAEMLAYYWYIVEHGASMLIVGGVATGKCIAPNDFIQLGSGEVRKIKEVYDEVVNSNPHPKIELFTLAENLKMEKKRINKFWKLEAPDILVDVKTNSGCKITTTPEHEFLCLKNGKIQKVRSDRLREGDYVASPRKIDIEGKTQKIPFTEWVDSSVYISKPRSLIEGVLDKARKKYGGIYSLAKKMNLNRERVRGWFNGNSIPFTIFKKIVEDLGLDSFESFEGDIRIKTKTGHAEIKPINRTSMELLKLVGYVVGDGGIYNNGVHFFNECKSLRDDFTNLVKGFGLSPREEHQKNRTPKVVVQNKAFESFLSRVFEIPKNSKSRIVDIPDIVMRCPKDEVAAFVKGLFDSEGSVSKKECEVEFSTSSTSVAYKLPNLLRRFGIVARIREKRLNGKMYYRVVISGKRDLEMYKNIIGFTDKQKVKPLDEIIKKTSYYHTNVDVIPVGQLIKYMIERNSLTISEVAKRAGIARESLRDILHLKTNPTKRLLKKIVFGLEKLLQERAIQDSELNELKLLVNSDIFWDRVGYANKKVGKEEFVYDFTVDNTHNFVAGNGGGIVVSNTSFLNTVCMFIPPEAKIVSIEDTRELRIPNEHWVPSLARTGFGIPLPTGEKYGGVSLYDLLKESFRQNPDYVIVGETRGAEAYVMFQGMSSGHPSMSTFHAGSVDTVIKRLTTPPIELSPMLIESLNVITIMMHAREKGKSARRIREVVEIESVDPRTDEVKTNTVFQWDPVEDAYKWIAPSIIVERLVKARGGTVEEAYAEIERRRQIIEWMFSSEVFDYKEATSIINRYYKEPESLIKEIGLPIKMPKHIELPVVSKKAVAKAVIKFGPPTKLEPRARPFEEETMEAEPSIAPKPFEAPRISEKKAAAAEEVKEVERARKLIAEMQGEIVETEKEGAEAKEKIGEVGGLRYAPLAKRELTKREKTLREKERLSTLSLLGFKFIKEK